MVFRRYHSPVNLSTRERQLITTLVVLLIVLATFHLFGLVAYVALWLIVMSPRLASVRQLLSASV